MSLIPSMLGELTALCISDIPFFMHTCTNIIGGAIPIIGPIAKTAIRMITDIFTRACPGLVSAFMEALGL